MDSNLKIIAQLLVQRLFSRWFFTSIKQEFFFYLNFNSRNNRTTDQPLEKYSKFYFSLIVCNRTTSKWAQAQARRLRENALVHCKIPIWSKRQCLISQNVQTRSTTNDKAKKRTRPRQYRKVLREFLFLFFFFVLQFK